MRVHPLRIAVVAAAVRLVGGLIFGLLTLRYPEGHIGVLADLPTILVYWVVQLFGIVWSIPRATDVRFLVVAVVTWGFLGYFIGWGAKVITRRPRRGGSAAAS